MSAWGKTGSARSCDALLKRVEDNDPRLTELVVLPLKTFGSAEVRRLAKCLESGTNTHLRSLQASGHAIDDLGSLEALGAALALANPHNSSSNNNNSHSLGSIAIGDSKLGDAGVCALCRGLESGGNNEAGPKAIDLSYKNVGKTGLTALLKALAGSKSLESIDLSRNETIGPSFDFCQAATELSLPLPLFPALTHLDLSECSLDASSCVSLVRAILTGSNANTDTNTDTNTKPLVIKLGANDLGDAEKVREMVAVLAGAGGQRVSELHIPGCRLGDEGLEQMVGECDSGSGSHLATLDISNNQLSTLAPLADDGTGEGRSRCRWLSNLRSLNASGNPLGSGLVSLAVAAAPWIRSLHQLDLSHTSCGVTGAAELLRGCDVPESESTLRTLNLFGNNLGTEGFVELAGVLEGGHSSLQYLDLGGNGASEAGVVALVEGLLVATAAPTDADEKSEECDGPARENNALRVLVVGGNAGGPALEEAVRKAQTVHPNLDIARDKPKRKDNNGGGDWNGGNPMNNAPGTSWMA
eukprot:jgi/Psemu1/282229/fgenesh1_pg.4_\